MKTDTFFLLTTIWLCLIGCQHHKHPALTSPDGRIQATIEPQDGSASTSLVFYMQESDDHCQRVLEVSHLGIGTEKGKGHQLQLTGIDDPVRIEDDYILPTGKRSHCIGQANEYRCHFKDQQQKEVCLRLRLYNDGAAFRYELTDLQEERITGEETTYCIPEGTRRWMQKYNESYEEFFPMTTSGQQENRHWGYPALVQCDPAGDTWTLISEAGIRRCHSASSLKNEQNDTKYQVTLHRNDQVFTGEWTSPWRVIVMGTLQDITSSTLITDVSEPCQLADTEWIRPGSAAWIYWAYNRGSKDYRIVKQYIDLAATMQWPYVLIDWEWDVMGNGGTIDDALRYAREKGVRTLLWYNSSTAWTDNGAAGPLYKLNTPEEREKEFARLEALGVAGVKIDFFAGDTQETMAYCIDLLESAARHKLLVNFHGATLPRGWQRTYPNLMSVEGVYGAEWYNNGPQLTDKAAAHNATLPFTRNVVGSMDYTPCTFSDSQHPHITTHAHELALSVVFESGLLHWADKPESYLAQPEQVLRFMTQLPTAWDETRLLAGYPGDGVVMARRKGTTWYVAALNGRNEQQALSFQWPVTASEASDITLFEDSGDAGHPWKISHRTSFEELSNTILLQPRGGFVAVIR